MIFSLPLCLLPKAVEYVNNALPRKTNKQKNSSCCSIAYSSLQHMQKDNYQRSVLERRRGKMYKHVDFTWSKAI